MPAEGSKLSVVSNRYATSTATPRATSPADARLCGDVNLRGVPAAVGPVYGWLRAGESVTVYEVRNGWGRVGADRWITLAEVCRD